MTQVKKLPQLFFRKALFALMMLLFCRIISMWFIPLNDVSEARYGEIARKMLETGNWVTPQHDYGVPFWAKPPLSTWTSAFSMKLFGVNEFAVRLPGLLFSLAALWLIWDLAKKHSGSFNALLTIIVLSGALYFFLDAGTVMTDPSLVFCITLVLVAFWHALVDGNKYWSYVFFIGLGLGLLAKGPVALVLSGMPLFFWVLLRNQWSKLWEGLPWIKGTLLMFAIALPWYIWAEIRTPGFLNYFIVGENFHRFLTPGWVGDKYGFAHRQPWGMIWVYAMMGIFPWSLLAVFWYTKHRHNIPKLFQDKDGWLSYSFLWTIVPLCFFTFSSNIIYTYVFPTLPAFSLFFVEYWSRVGAITITKAQRLIIRLSLVIGVIFLVSTIAFNMIPKRVSKTQKPVITAWLKQNPSAGSYLIYWDFKTEYSAQFYAGGKVKFAASDNELCNLLRNQRENYLAISPYKIDKIAPGLLSKMTQVTEVYGGDKPYLLMRIPVFSNNYCDNVAWLQKSIVADYYLSLLSSSDAG